MDKKESERKENLEIEELKLDELSKEQLIELIEKSKLDKKYGLVWEEIPEDIWLKLKKFNPS